MTQVAQYVPYQRRPIRRTLKAISRGLVWIDHWALRPRIKPFTLSFMFAALLLTGTAYAVSPWYELILNKSDSLPGVLFLLDKTTAPTCGDTTVLDMPVDGRFYRGSRLIKIIRGCEGDVITSYGREVFINQHSIGLAMQKSTDGKYALYRISEGVIPKNKVYLMAPHHQSYDSRYASFGLRDRQELLGSAYRIF